MVGATVTTLAIGGGMLTAPTVVLGLLASIVALGRRTSASPGGISLPSVLQAAHSSPSLASLPPGHRARRSVAWCIESRMMRPARPRRARTA
jgi:hypothetical protein